MSGTETTTAAIPAHQVRLTVTWRDHSTDTFTADAVDVEGAWLCVREPDGTRRFYPSDSVLEATVRRAVES